MTDNSPSEGQTVVLNPKTNVLRILATKEVILPIVAVAFCFFFYNAGLQDGYKNGRNDFNSAAIRTVYGKGQEFPSPYRWIVTEDNVASAPVYALPDANGVIIGQFKARREMRVLIEEAEWSFVVDTAYGTSGWINNKNLTRYGVHHN